MTKWTKFSCCLSALLLLTTSCGEQQEKPRTKTFLAVEKPVKVRALVFPGIVRNSQGTLFMTLFIHSAFPSALDARDAIAIFASRDDGATWQETSRIPSFVTYGVWGYDLAIDDRDILYMTWVAAVRESATPQMFKAIMFSRSDDAGRSWTEPIWVNDAETGQRRNPVIAVFGDDVHIAWLDERAAGGRAPRYSPRGDVYSTSSADRGATWSSNVCLETDLDKKDSASGVPSLCVGADGTVYCAYFSTRRYKRNEGGCWLAKSTDHGKTFSANLCLPGPLGDIFITEADGRLRLATVYLSGIKSIALQSPQTFQKIRFYLSSDRGATWDKHTVIDDDEEDKHKNNLKLVSVGVDGLVACWNDDRGGVYMAASTDGGETWGKNLKVAGPSHAGNTPIDIAADVSSGGFYLLASDIQKGPGDKTYLVRGKVVP